ncbi:hypothetical protein N6H14_15490 [Paenibacillus sp. CC-CFT747]|nr:hypothetical protein N6H14_15490 [Paenibacillus sp. CC-CFT747]
MNISLTTLTVEVEITAHGDVLLGGSLPDGALLLGTALKHRLFARHKESFYGTGLEVLEADGVEFVHLPAEQVIPYFAGPSLLRHIEWSWNAKGQPFSPKPPSREMPGGKAFRSRLHGLPGRKAGVDVGRSLLVAEGAGRVGSGRAARPF